MVDGMQLVVQSQTDSIAWIAGEHGGGGLIDSHW
jgi:hypothetical protein